MGLFPTSSIDRGTETKLTNFYALISSPQNFPGCARVAHFAPCRYLLCSAYEKSYYALYSIGQAYTEGLLVFHSAQDTTT